MSDNEDQNLSLESIADLNEEFVANLLRRNWPIPHHFHGVKDLWVEQVNQGVLSHVYRVHLQYEYGENDDNTIPTQWVVKLPRKDLNLEWMFRSEKVFYENFAPIFARADLPFTVPRMLLATETCLILEGIADMTCYDLISGTPLEKIDFVTSALASLHAKSWRSHLFESQTKDLNNPPGMGQRLHPLQKEYLFTQQWRDVVKNINMEESPAKEFIVDLCEQLESRRIRDIHALVHEDRYACVHGDFHIANFLFPNDKSQKPSLVDWATFGFGNPMTDLVFFLVLNESVASTVEGWLRKYYDCLTKYNPDVLSSFSFESLLEKLRWAMICQWMILVAYDIMSRQLADDGQDPSQVETKLKHFRNVNRRAVIAMHGVGKFETIIKNIPKVTELEHKEARDFCSNTPLSI